MRVFISHSSNDKPAVLKLNQELRDRGFETWMDQFEILPGDNIVEKIDEGLEKSDAGIIVLSKNIDGSPWIKTELNYLIYACIKESKRLIPVELEEGGFIPPLIRPLAKCGIHDIDAITMALRQETPDPSFTGPASLDSILIRLMRNEDHSIQITASIGGKTYGETRFDDLPSPLVTLQNQFLQGFKTWNARDPVDAERVANEKSVVELGAAIRDFCLPEDSGDVLTSVIDNSNKINKTVEVCFEADDPALLGLPFEALRLPDNRLLTTQPTVVMYRRLAGELDAKWTPLPSPIKILVAVGAPDEGQTGAVVLDYEREMQIILDAVEQAQRLENVQVRILEVGHPKVIGDAIERDTYHVLHLSCHGMPGFLELEDEEGRAVKTSADDLLDPILTKGKPLPLVFLNSCKGGVQEEETASFAEALLRKGVPSVIAMQASVSDWYATELARAFYNHLAVMDRPWVSRALALARKDLEDARQNAIQTGAGLGETQPEYATPAFYLAGEEQPLADYSLTKEPLTKRPVYEVSGPVPQLRIDDLIGRRKELRETLRTLRDPNRQYAGVVLTGIGGVGKSALAGRAMRRLVEEDWLVPACKGRLNLGDIALVLGLELMQSKNADWKNLGKLLCNTELNDIARMQLIGKCLAEAPVVLVLDDFEQNLTQDGAAFLDPDTDTYLQFLAQSARKGRLLITCRYPVPNTSAFFRHISIGPLSPSESRKLILRLPELKGRPVSDIVLILRVIGGHPRMLELLDSLLNHGTGRLPHVTVKLQDLLKKAELDEKTTAADLEEGIQQTLLLGARDVFLAELFAIAKDESIDEILLQTAVSNLPISPEGVAHMLTGAPADPAPVEQAFDRLERLSLIYRFPDGSAWIHRWTAEGLLAFDSEDAFHQRCVRAGRYRMWKGEKDKYGLTNEIEAIRNYLKGKDFDEASKVALMCINTLKRFQQTAQVAALAGEVLESLPEEHKRFAAIADEEAQSHLALGFTERAFERYQQLCMMHERLTNENPDRADYQYVLSVSYERMGDLYLDLGQGGKAQEAYQKLLDIIKQLVNSEPDRADYQRQLSVTYNKIGDLYRALGEGGKAQEAYQRSLEIRERLVKMEPDRADYQRILSVSYNKMGDLYSAQGEGGKAQEAYQRSLEIFERLANSEPDRADYQHDLSVSYERMGDLYRALGEGGKAQEAYQRSLEIRERLASSEPDRADYQHDLLASYDRLGDLYCAQGEGGKAQEAFQRALEIIERLANAETDRADYQRDLSVSYNKMGDLYRAQGEGGKAQEAYQQALDIAERLASSEPDRADYQRDLSVSYNKMGDLYRAQGEGGKAQETYQRSLEIMESLASSEPDRADYQRDLSVSYNKMGDLYSAQGEGGKAQEAYQRSLEIRERLVKIEPDRADYQRDLITMYVRISGSVSEKKREYLERALSIATALKNEGRLNPADYWFIDEFQKRLDEC